MAEGQTDGSKKLKCHFDSLRMTPRGHIPGEFAWQKGIKQTAFPPLGLIGENHVGFQWNASQTRFLACLTI